MHQNSIEGKLSGNDGYFSPGSTDEYFILTKYPVFIMVLQMGALIFMENGAVENQADSKEILISLAPEITAPTGKGGNA